jgi:hypothetical protein
MHALHHIPGKAVDLLFGEHSQKMPGALYGLFQGASPLLMHQGLLKDLSEP